MSNEEPRKGKRKREDETSNVEEPEDEVSDGIAEPFLYGLGADATSVPEIRMIIADDGGALLGDTRLYEEVEDFIETALADESKTEENLQRGLILFGRTVAKYNRAWHGVEGTFASYAIELGKVLHVLKALVKRCGMRWEPWAAENLRFMKDSTRQNYMRLAERPDAHPYAFLGTERLLHLISATKGIKSEDPIGKFLGEFALTFDVEGEVLLSDFKNQVDGALFAAKARRFDLNLDRERVGALFQIGTKMDNELIRTLAVIQKTGGDPNRHLETLHLNQGLEEDILEPQKRIEGFTKLVTRLNATIDSIVSDPDLLTFIDEEIIRSLEERIKMLREQITSR